MDWSAALDAKAPSFITLSSPSGTGLTANNSGASDSVNINPAGQAAGTYQTTVTISGTDEANSSAAQHSPQTITITITITEQPSMQLSSNSVTFTPPSCTYKSSSSIKLTNTGGGTLAWSLADPVYTDSGDPGSWLSVSPPTTGSGDATLTFNVDGTVAQLVPGQTYTATITITGTDQANGNAAKNSPQTVSVSFTEPTCLS